MANAKQRQFLRCLIFSENFAEAVRSGHEEQKF